MALKKSLKRGFTLVELMIVVAIIGVLAALAIYGVRRYVFTAKTAEAKAGIGRMAKDAANAFNDPKMDDSVLSFGETADDANVLCPDAADPVPSALANIAAKKYQSSPEEWDDGAGFDCLGFSMGDPQYYQYDYSCPVTTGDGATFTAIARGDLDGDGQTSLFTMLGNIEETSDAAACKVAPNFDAVDELE